MKMLAKLAVLSVLIYYCSAADLFSFKDCAGTKLKVDNITISPLPIKLSETDLVTVSGKVEILEDLPIDALVELKIVKLVQIGTTRIDIPIPCVDDLGSCTLKLCDLFSKWYNDILCPFMEKSNVKCQCPIAKGVFEAKDIKVTVPFAKIKGMIAQLASGDYNIGFRITDPLKKANYACVDLHANLVIDKPKSK